MKPVELRIPHRGGQRPAGGPGRWNVSLKASNEMGQWRQIDLPQRGDDPSSEPVEDAKNFRNHLSIFVDHF